MTEKTKEKMKRTTGKIINDPVLGFISLPFPILYDLLQHPWLLRLARIRQLGLSMLVYPGNTHSRLLHSLGAMHLTKKAIETLRGKGIRIEDEEAEATLCAVLLHDIGHGPFSHALEGLLVKDMSHEEITLLLMRKLNEEMNGALELAIKIFRDAYPRHFLHQLISSQLDMDRLDYLVRDSFFSGVREGGIGAERLIDMLNVHDDRLVVDAKGLYSVENFLIARRLMYWQVYLHKTDVAAETMLRHVTRRAQALARSGAELFGSPHLQRFLKQEISRDQIENDKDVLADFCLIDDNDVISALKVWNAHEDFTLRTLASGIVDRRLFKVKVSTEREILEAEEEAMQSEYKERFRLTTDEARLLTHCGKVSSRTYKVGEENILIYDKSGNITELSSMSDIVNTNMLKHDTAKYYLCYYKAKKA